MLLALALSLLFAQAADGVGLETPQGWKRTEDPQKRFVQIRPGDVPAGRDATVLVYPAVDATEPVEAMLDQMVKNMSQGKRLLSAVQKVDVGPFRVAVFTQQTPQGWMEYMAAHMIRWGGKAQAILFAASDPELFKTHTPTVAAMLTKAVVPSAAAKAPAGGDYAGMKIPFPAGFTRKDDPSGWILLTPPQELSRGNAVIWIAPTRKIQGSHWEAHRALLKGLVEQAKWPGSYADVADVAPGPFIRTLTHCSADARALRLFTAVAGDQMEAIVCNPDASDELLRVLHAAFEKTTLKNAPAEGPKRPQVLEAYRRPAQKKYFNANGTYTLGRLMYERILLLDNGVADCSACYDEGFAASESLWKIDPGCQNGFYGKWTAEGKTVKIKRGPEMAEQVYERDNGTLRFGDQDWRPMPRVDGLKLSGRYSSKSLPGAPLQYNYWAEFTEDGTFKTGGLLTSIAATDMLGRAKPPENCSGTYEIRDWTIFFKVDGKLAWSTDFMTTGEDLKDLKIILLDTSGYSRE